MLQIRRWWARFDCGPQCADPRSRRINRKFRAPAHTSRQTGGITSVSPWFPAGGCGQGTESLFFSVSVQLQTKIVSDFQDQERGQAPGKGDGGGLAVLESWGRVAPSQGGTWDRCRCRISSARFRYSAAFFFTPSRRAGDGSPVAREWLS